MVDEIVYLQYASRKAFAVAQDALFELFHSLFVYSICCGMSVWETKTSTNITNITIRYTAIA